MERMVTGQADGRRQSAELVTDPGLLGLRRLVVPTSVGYVVVHVGREAGGPATILLHGAAGSWTTWSPLLAESDRVGRPLTDVVAVDLPGWGESAASASIDEVGDLTDAIVEIAAALGYRHWSVLGHSLGGLVALDLAVRAPHATVSVGLVSPSGAGVLDAIRRPLRGGRRLPGLAGMLVAMRALAPFGAAGRALIRGLHRVGLLAPLSRPLFARPASIHPSVIDALSHEIRPGAFAQAARIAKRYRTEAWSAVRCPVRSVRGADDVFAGERDWALFAGLIADYRELRLENAGHFAGIEAPTATLAFLRG
ncbi:alpha/beta hydrolase [Herbiconiux sp. L3-i23]|nr:alpha/beta hydrolase [Herbiconiux sp. L3-i23]